MNNGIFVKVNYKNLGELNSFIYDRKDNTNKLNEKYVMCAGKYSKEGWTIVFKAKNINEAEELLSRNSKKRQQIINSQIIDNETVSIPYWM